MDSHEAGGKKLKIRRRVGEAAHPRGGHFHIVIGARERDNVREGRKIMWPAERTASVALPTRSPDARSEGDASRSGETGL